MTIFLNKSKTLIVKGLFLPYDKENMMTFKTLTSPNGTEFLLLKPEEERQSKIGQVEWRGVTSDPEVIVRMELPVLDSDGASAIVSLVRSDGGEYLAGLRFGPTIPLAGLPDDIVVKLTDMLEHEGFRNVGRELAAKLAPDAKIVIDLTDNRDPSAVLTVGGHSKEAFEDDVFHLKRKLLADCIDTEVF